ncbi:MAG: hypothetical protein JWN98_928, partial [Abditibacteriota bacterium]|nr:hypothetical protein [Abditibacteriota bacterium]
MPLLKELLVALPESVVRGSVDAEIAAIAYD